MKSVVVLVELFDTADTAPWRCSVTVYTERGGSHRCEKKATRLVTTPFGIASIGGPKRKMCTAHARAALRECFWRDRVEFADGYTRREYQAATARLKDQKAKRQELHRRWLARDRAEERGMILSPQSARVLVDAVMRKPMPNNGAEWNAAFDDLRAYAAQPDV